MHVHSNGNIKKYVLKDVKKFPHLYHTVDVDVDVELESTCLAGSVRPIALSLYCFDSTQPLSCLGSLVVEHLPSKQYVVGSSPTFFIFYRKGVVQISFIALF